MGLLHICPRFGRMPKYLVRFAQIDEKNSFRLPELDAICEINRIPFSYAAHAYTDEVYLISSYREVFNKSC